MHVFGDRPFVDHYLWWPPLTQEINRLVCCFGTNELSVYLLGYVFKVCINTCPSIDNSEGEYNISILPRIKHPHLITCSIIMG